MAAGNQRDTVGSPMTRMKPYVKSLLAFLLIAGIYLLGWLDFIDNKLNDVRYGLATRPATGALTVVKIDPNSLEEVGVWPWPRSVYAEVLDRLFAAGATDVALDIDFSSVSTPAEDQRLADALRRHGQRVILPVFKQRDRNVGGRSLKYTEPIPAFAEHARVASLNVVLGATCGAPRNIGRSAS